MTKKLLIEELRECYQVNAKRDEKIAKEWNVVLNDGSCN